MAPRASLFLKALNSNLRVPPSEETKILQVDVAFRHARERVKGSIFKSNEHDEYVVSSKVLDTCTMIRQLNFLI